MDHASDTAKALDSGKGDSLVLSDTELEGSHLAKRILSSLDNPPPLHAAIQELVAARKLLGNRPIIPAIEKYLAEASTQHLKPVLIPDLVEEFISSKEADGVTPQEPR